MTRTAAVVVLLVTLAACGAALVLWNRCAAPTPKGASAATSQQVISEAERENVQEGGKKADMQSDKADEQAKNVAANDSRLKERQIKQLFTQADEMMMAQRYDEAETVVKSILALEPENAEAKVFLEQIARFRSREIKLRELDERIRELRD
jgi:hypothetical protein